MVDLLSAYVLREIGKFDSYRDSNKGGVAQSPLCGKSVMDHVLVTSSHSVKLPLITRHPLKVVNKSLLL